MDSRLTPFQDKMEKTLNTLEAEYEGIRTGIFKSSAKDSARRPLGRELRGGRPRRVGRAGLAGGTGPWGLAPLTWVGAGGGRRRRLLAWILT